MMLRSVYPQERKSNKLRDYTTMAGPLGVSHLLLFSRSTSGNTNLRLALTPRGPTLHFRVEKYSLCKDIRNSMRHPKGSKQDFLTPPLLVMNNLTSKATSGSASPISKQVESLTSTVFQSLFPPISPQHTPLSSIRRVLILDRELSTTPNVNSSLDGASYFINLRHYAIVTKKRGLSRGIRRLDAAKKASKDSANRRRLLNLGKLDDVAEYLLNPDAACGGYTSGSESEAATDVEVEVLETSTRKVTPRGQVNSSANGDEKELGQEHGGVEKRAIKLIELGPRMRLRMTKIEEGVCTGRVMWHEYLVKSKTEMEEMEQIWERRRQGKEERKKAQKENVERKRRLRSQTTGKIDEDLEMLDEEEWTSDGLNDASG